MEVAVVAVDGAQVLHDIWMFEFTKKLKFRQHGIVVVTAPFKLLDRYERPCLTMPRLVHHGAAATSDTGFEDSVWAMEVFNLEGRKGKRVL